MYSRSFQTKVALSIKITINKWWLGIRWFKVILEMQIFHKLEIPQEEKAQYHLDKRILLLWAIKQPCMLQILARLIKYKTLEDNTTHLELLVQELGVQIHIRLLVQEILTVLFWTQIATKFQDSYQEFPNFKPNTTNITLINHLVA